MPAVLSPKLASRLETAEAEAWEKPWVHNFAPLDLPRGPQTDQRLQLQLEKQGQIFRHVRDAVKRCEGKPQGVCLTFNDGLFGLYALKCGASRVDIFGVGGFEPQHEPWHLDQTAGAVKLLKLQHRVTIQKLEIDQVPGGYDFGVFVGGLSHYQNPLQILADLRAKINGSLVLYSPTFLPAHPRPHEDPNDWALHFESPAEGRPWGSRFGHKRLILMAVDAGWTVVNEKFQEMPIPFWTDRGSSCLHCV